MQYAQSPLQVKYGLLNLSVITEILFLILMLER